MGQGKADVGIIGLGSMGGGMILLFAECGSIVAGIDKSPETTKKTTEMVRTAPSVSNDVFYPYDNLADFAAGFKPDKPRIIVLSLPHGEIPDGVLDELRPHLKKGDVIIDFDNEWWKQTERRQASFKDTGIHFIGSGVSGGYQSARHGPSMSPSGTREAYDIVAPLLEKWAARDAQGRPCVDYIGPGGSGHFVKMVHNGIEQGELGAICEAHALLHHTLGLSNDEIAEVFSSWNAEGELRQNFLVGIGAEILRFKRGEGVEDQRGIVDDFEDKVTQDDDDSEATGVWTLVEAARRHVSLPTISAAHYLRVLTGNRGERDVAVKNLRIPQPTPLHERFKAGSEERKRMIQNIRLSVYGTTLASFVQGMNLIARASKDEDWGVSPGTCIRIWRAGCIIQSDHIADLLQPIRVYEREPELMNALFEEGVGTELCKTFDALKTVCALALESNGVVPSISATLDYLKAAGGEQLPTNFMEAEMVYFGHHNYDLKNEHSGSPEKGAHHTEFKPA